MKGKCIICLQDQDLTVEHVVPESVGGKITISAVCKPCNNLLSKNIDEPFSKSSSVSIFRFADGVAGKRGDVPNPFRTGGVLTDGTKVGLSDDMIPHTVPSVKEERSTEGAIKIDMSFDVADEAHLREAALKKVEKALKELHGDWSEDELVAKTKEVVEMGLKSAQRVKNDSMIGYHFTVDLGLLEREYLKIAYEMAFRQFGYGYVESSQTASTLRSALAAGSLPGDRYVRVPVAESPFDAQVADQRIHFVGLLGGTAWIRIAGICGCVIFEEQDARFMVPTSKSVLETFDTRPQD